MPVTRVPVCYTVTIEISTNQTTPFNTAARVTAPTSKSAGLLECQKRSASLDLLRTDDWLELNRAMADDWTDYEPELW